MSRSPLLLLLVLSVGLMGGSTCRFSTGGKNDGDSDGSGVEIIVDTRTSGGGSASGPAGSGGSGAGSDAATVIATAVATHALAPALPGDEGLADGGRGASIGPLVLVSPVALASPETPASHGAGSAVPEPAAGLLFAAGASLVAWSLRRRR